MDIKNIINKSLLNYDITNEKYSKFINDDSKIKNNKIVINNKDFKYEVLGIFDTQTNIWLWSWLIPSIKQEHINISRYLLDYGLNLTAESNMKEMMFLKTQLTNSRFILEDSIQLDIHLAICSYLLNENIKFIYPQKQILSKNHSIIVYYIIK
jgi:hypothetical protein